MNIYKTKIPISIFNYALLNLANLFILWFLLFNHHVLAMPWIAINIINLVIILAVFSGWQRSILMVDERKIVICRPAGWLKQTNFIVNMFEINHIEFEKNYILIGRFDSQTAIKFGPLKNAVKLNNYLKQLLPKIVL